MKFYKHMTNMRHDPRIKRLISRYGIEGYGLYNIILETIAERIDDETPLPILQENCEDLADFYNGNTAKINEIVCFMVNQNLFEVEEIEGKILCGKIYKFLESSSTRSEAIRRLIKAYKNVSETQLLTYNQVSQTVSDKSEEENRREQNRQEESTPPPAKKTELITLTNGTQVPVNITTHTSLLDTYGKNEVERYYTKIADYVASKGKRDYKDYAATARNWIDGDIKKGNGPAVIKPTTSTTCPACGNGMAASGCNWCGLNKSEVDDAEAVEYHREHARLKGVL
jgi:hypothetical protein